MSLKPIWKERAIARANEPKPVFGPSPLTGFRPKSFEEIQHELREALKQRMLGAASAIDDPTSNFGQLIGAIAQVDAEQYEQLEKLQANVIADFIVNKGVKLK